MERVRAICCSMPSWVACCWDARAALTSAVSGLRAIAGRLSQALRALEVALVAALAAEDHPVGGVGCLHVVVLVRNDRRIVMPATIPAVVRSRADDIADVVRRV